MTMTAAIHDTISMVLLMAPCNAGGAEVRLGWTFRLWPFCFIPEYSRREYSPQWVVYLKKKIIPTTKLYHNQILNRAEVVAFHRFIVPLQKSLLSITTHFLYITHIFWTSPSPQKGYSFHFISFNFISFKVFILQGFFYFDIPSKVICHSRLPLPNFF